MFEVWFNRANRRVQIGVDDNVHQVIMRVESHKGVGELRSARELIEAGEYSIYEKFGEERKEVAL